jgi:hypothetical protein
MQGYMALEEQCKLISEYLRRYRVPWRVNSQQMI